MARSRSRERRRSRDKSNPSRDKSSRSVDKVPKDKRSRSKDKGPKDKESRSRDRRSRSKDYRRRDKSRSRERDNNRDRHEPSSSKRHRTPDRRRTSRERDRSSRYKDRSQERPKRRDSRERKRDRSSSRSKKPQRSSSREKVVVIQAEFTKTRRQRNSMKAPVHMPNDDSTSSTEKLGKTYDPRKTFEISNEFSREGFEQFTRDHGIDFENIETEEDRVAVHDKMEDLLKEHFAAQGKIYPPPKIEKPAINAATGFANDGSFMEQFKRMQDEYKLQQEAEKKRKAAEVRLQSLPIRRRGGGKILKTGVVAKTKLNEDGSEVPASADPWSMYLKEVQKYKSASCDSDSNTRPLVK